MDYIGSIVILWWVLSILLSIWVCGYKLLLGADIAWSEWVGVRIVLLILLIWLRLWSLDVGLWMYLLIIPLRMILSVIRTHLRLLRVSVKLNRRILGHILGWIRIIWICDWNTLNYFRFFYGLLGLEHVSIHVINWAHRFIEIVIDSFLIEC